MHARRTRRRAPAARSGAGAAQLRRACVAAALAPCTEHAAAARGAAVAAARPCMAPGGAAAFPKPVQPCHCASQRDDPPCRRAPAAKARVRDVAEVTSQRVRSGGALMLLPRALRPAAARGAALAGRALRRAPACMATASSSGEAPVIPFGSRTRREVESRGASQARGSTRSRRPRCHLALSRRAADAPRAALSRAPGVERGAGAGAAAGRA